MHMITISEIVLQTSTITKPEPMNGQKGCFKIVRDGTTNITATINANATLSTVSHPTRNTVRAGIRFNK